VTTTAEDVAMQHDEFITAVQIRAQLPSRAVAERITGVTLESLAERVPADLAEAVAERLPYRTARYLRRHPKVKRRFDRHGFFAAVHERADGPAPSAAYGARVVLEQLAAVVADEAAETPRGEAYTADDLIGRLYQAMPHDLRHLVRHRNHARQ
jgi:uncharacterized protein (DUF2267 family)